MSTKTYNPDNAPTPGEGYRFLNEGEVLVKTDEIYKPLTSTWIETLNEGREVGSTGSRFTYRRKVETVAKPKTKRIRPQKGYRMLKRGEKIEKGDIFHQKNDVFNQGWTEVGSSIGLTVGDKNRSETLKLVFSRKIKEKKAEAPKKLPPSDMPKGYRVLEKGEVIQQGDKGTQHAGGWINLSDTVGMKAGDAGALKWNIRKIEVKVPEVKPEPVKSDKWTISPEGAQGCYNDLQDILGTKHLNVVSMVRNMVQDNQALKNEVAALKAKLEAVSRAII